MNLLSKGEAWQNNRGVVRYVQGIAVSEENLSYVMYEVDRKLKSCTVKVWDKWVIDHQAKVINK